MSKYGAFNIPVPKLLPVTLAAAFGLSAYCGGLFTARLEASARGRFMDYRQSQPDAQTFGGYKLVKFRPPTQDNNTLTTIDRDKIYRQTDEKKIAVNTDYGFYNFTRDYLNVSYSIAKKDLNRYVSGFGYSDADLENLRAKRREIEDMAYQFAVKNGMSQAELDEAGQLIDQTYENKVAGLFIQKGFKLKGGNVIAVNVPQIVKNHKQAMLPVSQSFSQIASDMDYDSMALVGAVLSLVQTGLEYKVPPERLNGKYTGGILVPPYAMAYGWGDCDTKTALMAAVLANFKVSMVGISLPDHYLMGVLASPQSGDVFVTYQGRKYVLVEPAGPGWFPPGKVGSTTMSKLKAKETLVIEPL